MSALQSTPGPAGTGRREDAGENSSPADGGLRIGIDTYGLLPLGLAPLDLLAWACEHGAEGVQFSGLTEEEKTLVDSGYLAEMRAFCESENLYLEWGGASHIPRDMQSWAPADTFAVNRRAAEQAAVLGTRVVRSCSGGLMRWDPASPETDVLLAETARALCEQRSMLRDHDVILSLELHFEFTTFELLRLFEMCEAEPGDWLGICLDTMNVLTMLEEPVAATRRVLPWVTSTHVKDGAVALTGEGLMTFPAAIGTGIVNLAGICDLLRGTHGTMNLSIEDHGGSFLLPIFETRFMAQFPDLHPEEYSTLKELAELTAGLIADGSCAMTGREEWPAICEARMRADLEALRDLVFPAGEAI